MKKGDEKRYFTATLVLFILVVAVHLTRIINGWDFSIGNALIPIWVSWIAVILLAILLYHNYKLLKR